MTAPASNSLQITVTKEGRLLFVWDDTLQPLLSLGRASIRRVSHVEPMSTNVPVDMVNRWSADLSPIGGPWLGPFDLREQALEAERDFLNSERGRSLLAATMQHEEAPKELSW